MAPEHSDAFNRTIKLYQATASVGVKFSGGSTNSHDEDSAAAAADPEPDCGGSLEPGAGAGAERVDMKKTKKKASGGLTVQDVQANPMLKRLLLLAAKNVKEQQHKQKEREREQRTQKERDQERQVQEELDPESIVGSLSSLSLASDSNYPHPSPPSVP